MNKEMNKIRCEQHSHTIMHLKDGSCLVFLFQRFYFRNLTWHSHNYNKSVFCMNIIIMTRHRTLCARARCVFTSLDSISLFH